MIHGRGGRETHLLAGGRTHPGYGMEQLVGTKSLVMVRMGSEKASVVLLKLPGEQQLRPRKEAGMSLSVSPGNTGPGAGRQLLATLRGFAVRSSWALEGMEVCVQLSETYLPGVVEPATVTGVVLFPAGRGRTMASLPFEGLRRAQF